MKKIILSLGLVMLFSTSVWSQVRIAVLGSSTSYCSGSSTGDSCWVSRLQAQYRRTMTPGDPDTVVTVNGWWGYTTYRVLPTGYTAPVQRQPVDPNQNITTVMATNPDIVIINLPSNDISYAYPFYSPAYTLKETMDNFRLLYNTVVSQGKRCFITSTQPRNDFPLEMRKMLSDLRDSLVQAFGNAVIDYYNDFTTTDGQYNLRSDIDVGDGIHPNNTGHRIIFQKVMARNIFGTLPPPPPPPPPGGGSTSKIEAESYTSMSGIQTEPTSDVGGGLNVGWQDTNDWMDYSVNVSTAGTYTVNFRVATMFAGPQFQVRNSVGTVLATVNVPNTGSFQSWQTTSAQVALQAGTQTIRIHTSNAAGGWNLNWFEIAGGASTPPPPPPPPPPGGSGSTIRIEAESYTGMSGVQTENTSDAGGGQNVGWQDTNDWMDYSVNVSAAGTYTVNFRVATMFTGPQFQLRNSSGGVLATVSVPNTGSFQSWQTVSAQVSLPAGQQTLRIYTSNAAGGWNINWWEIVGGQSAPPPSSTKIEAEHYTAMQGIQKEGCADAGGGENIGWQDTGDWMDYAVNVSSAATYTFNFRVASMFTGAQFQVRNSAGAVLATVTVPNTGSFQSWQTVSAQVALPAGSQTIRIHTSNAAGGWNLNWFEIAGGATATSARLAGGDLTADALETLQGREIVVFPNPVHDRLTLTTDNKYTGSIKVEIISITGSVVRNLQLQKTNAGTMRFYLSTGNLPKGTYIIRASMQNWSSSTQIIKE